MPLTSAAFIASRRSWRPNRLACAGPENGARAATAIVGASWREPPTALPTQLSSVRVASLRTGAGICSGVALAA